MIAFFEIITTNLNMDLITLIVLVLNLGMVLMMATDFRIGLIFMFMTNAMTFLLAYTNDWNYSLPLTLLFLSIGLLTLSLWSNNKYSGTGGLT